MKITRCLVVAFLCLAVSAHAADELIALKAARMFDGKSNALVQNGVVVVKGDKIVDVGSNLPIPSCCTCNRPWRCDALPRISWMRTRISPIDFSGDYNERRLKEVDVNVSEQAIRAPPLMPARLLKPGLRLCATWAAISLASHEFVDVALRNSINKGVIVGPRMLVATKGIGATGGHFDPTSGFRDFLFGREPDYTDGIADGA